MTVAFAVAATMAVAVWIYVHPAAHPGTKTHAPPGGLTWPATSASPMPSTSAPPMPTTLLPADGDLWRKCNQQHDDYKKTQDDATAISGQINPLANLLNNSKASAQQRADFCSVIDKLIKLKQQEHQGRSKYMQLDCDKFDWFDKGKTLAARLASHQGALDEVTAQLKNLYAMDKRFCQ